MLLLEDAHCSTQAQALHIARACKRGVAMLVIASLLITDISVSALFSQTFRVPVAQAATGIYKPISYQGKITDTNNTVISNGSYNMRFSIYDASTGGTQLWTETWNSGTQRVTMTGGLFTVLLGTHTAMTGVDFNTDNLYLNVEFDPGNDGTYEEVFVPRRRFSSVPYALNADKVDGRDASQFLWSDTSITASGTLTVRPRDASKTGISIESNAGTAAMAALKLSTQGANHIVFGTGAASYDTNLYRSAAGTLKTDGKFIATSGFSGSTIHTTGGITSSGIVVVDGRISTRSTLSGAALFIHAGSTSYIGGNLGIGTQSPDTKLEVIGTISGSALRISGLMSGSGGLAVQGNVVFRSLTGCTVLQTDSNGLLSCGSGSSGLTQTAADARYVNTSGDTMTGGLTINLTTGTLGLNVKQTISGATVFASSVLSTSGSLTVQGSLRFKSLANCDTIDTDANGNATCGTDADTNTTYTAGQGLTLNGTVFRVNSALTGSSLIVYGTMSGARLHVSGLITGSGGLTVGGSIRFRNLVSCNSIDTDSAGNLVCGTDETAASGMSQSDGDARYVNTAGDTMTGTLTINLTSGTLAINARQTISGAILTASNYLTSSGGLTVKGAVRFKSLSGCDTIDTDVNGNLACGTDLDTNTTYTAGQGLTLNGTAFRVSNAFSGTSLTIYGTMSGARLHVSGLITGSGNLLLKGNGTFRGTLSGTTISASNYLTSSGGLTVNSAVRFKSLTNCNTIDTDSAGNLVCGTDADTDTNTTYTAGQGLTLNGTVFRLNNTLTGSALTIYGTMSGARLHVSGLITGSGGLLVKGNGTFRGTLSGSTLNASNYLTSSGGLTVATSVRFKALTGCDTIDTDSAGNLSCGTDANTTYTAGQGLTLNSTVFRLNNTLTGSALTIYGTMSGARLHVSGLITGSGGLTVGGSIRFRNLVSCNSIDTDSAGNLVCGTDETAASGMSQSDGDARYVNTAGDTMTGTLTINLTSGVVGINSRQTISGSTIFASSGLSTSGALIVRQASIFYGNLVSRQTISGSILHASSLLSSSGGLTVNGAIRFKSLAGCDTIDTDGAGNLVCGTDANTTYTAGQGLTLNGTSFRLNSSLTGSALTIFGTMSGARLHVSGLITGSGNLLLKGNGTFRGTVSGSTLNASNYLTSSGGLTVRSSVRFKALTNCDTIDTDANGNLACGTDLDTNTTYTAGQGLTLNGTVFRLNNTLTGSALTIYGTMSGSRLHVSGLITGSGGLTVGGSIRFRNLVSCNSIDTDSAGNLICGTDETAASGISQSDGDARYVNTSGDTMTGSLTINLTAGTLGLNVKQAISGATIFASSRLATSGALVVQGSLQFRALSGCDTIDTDANGNASCGTDANTTYTAGQGLTLNGTVFRVNSALTGSSLIVYGTMSGARLHVSGLITGSGNLLLKGNGTFRGTLSGSTINASSYLTSSGGLTVATSVRFKALSGCNTIDTDSAGNLSCGTDANTTYTAGQGLTLNGTVFRLSDSFSGTSLTVRGTMSGSRLHVSGLITGSGGITITGTPTFRSLQSCSMLVTNSAGVVSCGTAYTQATADDRYVNTAGDTMTGALVIQNGNTHTATATPLLNVRGTMSGKSLAISGTGSYPLLTIDASRGWFIVSNSNPTSGTIQSGRLESHYYPGTGNNNIVLGAQSTGAPNIRLQVDNVLAHIGINIGGTANSAFTVQHDGTNTYLGIRGINYQNNVDTKEVAKMQMSSKGLNISTDRGYVIATISGGVFAIRSTATTLTAPTTGAGMEFSYDADDALQSTTGRSTILSYDRSATAFKSLRLNAADIAFQTSSSNRFAILANGTLSGSRLHISGLISASGGLLVRGNGTFRGTLSGTTVNASSALTSSGILTVRGAVRFKALTNCDTLDTDANGNLACGTDTDTNTTYTAGQGLTLNGTVFRLSDSFSGTSLTVRGTMSGARLHVSGLITGSGGITITGTTTLRSLQSCSMLVTSANGTVSCGTAYTQATADDRYVNTSGDTMTGVLIIQNGNTHTATSTPLLNVRGTMSGRSISITGTGASPLLSTSLGTGRLGVGTSSPLGILHTATTSSNETLLAERSGQTSDLAYIGLRVLSTKTTAMADGFGSVITFAIKDDDGTINVIGDIGAVRSGADNTGDLVFLPRTAGTPNERMRLSAAGMLTVRGTMSGRSLTISGTGSLPLLATDASLGRVVINGFTSQPFRVLSNVNAIASHVLFNQSSGTSASTRLSLQDSEGSAINIDMPGTGNTLSLWGTNRNTSTYIFTSGSTNSRDLLIGTNTADFLAFATSATERMRILETGEVGIGTSGADRALDVLNAGSPQIRLTYTDGSVYTDLQTDSSGYFNIDSTGNRVGIENTTPDTTLDVRGTISGSALKISGLISGSGGLLVRGNGTFRGTLSGSTINASSYLTSSGGLTVATSVRFKALSGCNTIDTDSAGNLSCGTDADTTYTAGQGLTLNGTVFRLSDSFSGSALTIRGTMSGSRLHVSGLITGSGGITITGTPTLRSLQSCSMLVTNSAGVVSCGTTYTQATADDRYVNTSGDTMTGILVIQNGNTHSSTSTPLLNVRGTMSGRAIYVSGTGGSPLLFTDITQGRIGVGTNTPRAKLDVVGTISGSALRINGRATFQGGAYVEAFFGGSWVNMPTTGASGIGSGGAGVNAWIAYASSSGYWFSNSTLGDIAYRNTGGKLLFGNTSGAYFMHIDSVGMGMYSTGRANVPLFIRGAASQSAALMQWQNSAGATLAYISSSGGLVLNEQGLSKTDIRFESDNNAAMFFLNTTTDKVGIGTPTPSTELDVIGTISGSALKISGLISGSGGLLIAGNATVRGTLSGSSLTISNLKNCALITTDASGNTSCGTAYTQATADDRYVNTSGDTMTGILVIQNGNTHSSTATPLLNVRGTISGAIIRSSGQLQASGSIVASASDVAAFLNTFTYKGSSASAGAFIILSANDGAALIASERMGGMIFNGSVNSSTSVNAAGIVAFAEANWLATSAPAYITFETVGYGTIVRTERMRLTASGSLGIGTAAPKAKLDVVGTISGSALKISGLISGSGGLLVRGNGTFRGTLSGSSLTVSSLRSCSIIVTDANGVTSCGSAPFTLAGGDARYLKLSGGTLTGTLAIQNGNTHTATATPLLNVRGTMSGRSVYISGTGASPLLFTDISSNRIGVGTSTPLYQVSIYQNDASATLGLRSMVGSTSEGSVIYLERAKGSQFVTDFSAGDPIGGIQARGYSAIGAGAYTDMGAIKFITDTFASAFTTRPSNIVFYTVPENGSQTERMVIKSTGRVGIATSTPDEMLDVVGTISGSALKISSLISGSGGIAIRGAVTFRSLASCSMLVTDASGVTSCGTAFTQTSADDRYVNTSGDTMTGILVIQNGNTHTATTTPLLNVRGTMSGQSLYVSGTGGNVNPLLMTNLNDGVVLIGSSLSIVSIVNATSGIRPKLQVNSLGTDAAMSFNRWSADGSSARFVFGKSRGATVGTHSAVSNADVIGEIVFDGSNGTAFHEAARIRGEVDGTAGSGDMPGRLTFWVTTDGSSTPVEKMRITNAGAVGINTTGPDRNLDVLNAGSPQIRLSYTDSSVFTDLQTNSSGYFNIGSSGDRVGIETTTPKATLDVAGSMSGRSLSIGSTTTTFPIAVRTTAGTREYFFRGTVSDDVNGAMLLLGNNTAGSTATHPALIGYNGLSSAPSMVVTARTSAAGDTGTTPLIFLQAGTTDSATDPQNGTLAGLGTRPVLGIFNQSAQVLTILANGHVGIGTTTPGSKLSVSGSVIIGANIGTIAGSGALHVLKSAETSTRELISKFSVSDDPNGALYIYNATSTNSTMIPGMTGVGNNPASTSLQIRGVTLAANDASDSSTSGLIAFVADRTDRPSDPLNLSANLTAIQNRRLFTFSNNSTIVMTVAASGNLGIGTGTPGSRLSVSGAVVIGGNIGSEIAKAQLDVKGTISGSLLTLNSAGTNYISNGTLVIGKRTISAGNSLEVAGTISGALLKINGDGQNYIKDGSLTIGRNVPKGSNALEVVGSISGSTLRLYGGAAALGINSVATPSAALTVKTTTNAVAHFYNTGTSGAAQGAGIISYSDDNAAMAAGDRLGFYLFGGSTAAGSLGNAAGITGYADAAWSATSIPAYLGFETAPSGSTTRIERMRISSSGAISIGSTAKIARLAVSGATIINAETATSTDNLFTIVSDVTSNENTVFRISASGAVYADGVYNSAGADYAEWFRASTNDLRPGELVCIDPAEQNTVKRCDRDADSNLMGIISTNPAFVGNRVTGADGLMPPGYVLVGLIGQVPATVIASSGAIRAGDQLTASVTPGIARKARAGEPTVGVALEPVPAGQTKVVNVLISRRNQSLTSEMVEQTVLDQIAAMNIQDEVQAMIGDALDRFSASGAIADMIENEVADQIDALDIAGQIRSEIDRQIAAGNFVNAATLTTQVDRLDARITALSDGQLSLDQITLALQSRYGLTEGDILGIDRDTSITGALNVSELLTANGGLRVDGSVQFSSLVNCPVIGTDDTGTLVCKAGGIDQAASDARYLSRAGGTLTGALTIDSAETDGAQNLIVLKSDVNKTDNTVFRVTATGGVYTNEAFHSAGADYAEWFFSTTPDMQKGDLVCIDTTRDNAVRKCDREADSDLMGIISTYPAFIGNSIGGAGGALGITPPGYVLVGLIGQVPAFVTGDVRPGDSLTASAIPGVARKANAGESTVGVALESHSGDGIGKVRVLISRRNQSLTVETVEDHVLDTIKAMAIEDEVEQMITKTMEDVNFNGAVTDEVLTQIEELQIQEQLTLVLDELSTLKEQVHAAAQTGSIAAVTSAHVSAENATLSGALTAESIESRTTMAIGSDLRVGGNVYLEGTLITGQLYVPNGLTVEGGFDLRGALSTTDLTVSSGATISGALVLQGDLTMASGSTLMLGSGAVTINNDGIQAQNLLVRDALVVLGNITISGLAQFLGNVEVHGQLIVSSRQAGFAEVQPGQMSVTVSFGTGFTAQPVVTASPDVPVLYAVSKASMTGFTIRLAEPAKELITFSWLSLGTIAIETTESDSDQAIPFPVDEKGVPVSTNLIWNQCIRGYTPLDESGQPFNCSRYRVGDGHTWLHPDLNIEFDWLTNLDTPELRLPENYFAQWQIGSSSSTSSISNSSESSVASESSSESSSSEAVSSSESSSFSESSESSASSESSNSEPIHEAPPAEEPLGPLEQEEVIEEILEVIEGQ